jgi:polysaccharide biosynthesis/export protein
MLRDDFPGSSQVTWKRLTVLLVLPVLFAAAASAQNQNNSGTATPSAAPDAPKALPGLNDPAASAAAVDQATYIIGPNDILDIEVFREKDWSHLYPVRTDGMISVDLVGEMRAAGLTPKQLEGQLADALKTQIKEPSVTVTVYDVRSKLYTVTGEVKRPGGYPLIKNPMTVFDAINEAGGFLDNFSDRKHITIIRGSQRIPFNYEDYVKGKHLDKNIALQNGDTIIVK